jgi:hypothetical protein
MIPSQNQRFASLQTNAGFRFAQFCIHGACHMAFEYGSVKKWDGNLSEKTEA